MTSTALPVDLANWVIDHFGPVRAVTDVSWPRANSRVWQVTTSSRSVFVKISPDAEDHARELAGHAFANRALDPDQAPQVLASDPTLRVLATSPLPGQVVRGLDLPVDEERQVYAQAGALMRRWHEHSPPSTDIERSAISEAITEQANEAHRILPLIAAHIDALQREWVKAAARELPQLTAATPVVYRHGDYATRNWLWDSRTERLGAIDFAMAAHGLLIQEFVWLHGAVWVQRADLRTAFFDGYGGLSQDEERALQLLTVRLAASYLATGLTNDDPVLIERGRLGLTHLEKAHQ